MSHIFFKLFIVLQLCIISLFAYSQPDFKVSIEFKGAKGSEFVGYKIDKDSLYVGKYFWKKSLFKEDYRVYKSITIASEDLNKLTLLRIRLLLVHNDFFRSIESFYAETTGQPVVYKIENNDNNIESLIYDYKYFEDSDLSRERYLLSELLFLIGELLPDEHYGYRFHSAIYENASQG